MNVLSLFDGMSCGRLALDRAGIQYGKYYASEVDKFAIKVAMHNYPDTIQLGDVRNVTPDLVEDVQLLLGGSPCQGFSFAGKGLNFEDPRSKLFFEFVRLKNELSPKYFLLENVQMKREHQMIISKYLGVEPIVINSVLVSAQNRVRYYWTNIMAEPFNLFGDMRSTIPQPKDRGILLADILETQVDEKYFLSGNRLETMLRTQGKFSQLDGKKAYTLTARAAASWRGDFMKLDVNGNEKANQKKASCFTAGAISAGNHSDMDIIAVHNTQPRTSKSGNGGTGPLSKSGEKSYCLDTGQVNILEFTGTTYRRLTPVECERLQTVPDNYTNHVSDSQRYKMLGNGWTVDVIAYILSHIKQNVVQISC